MSIGNRPDLIERGTVVWVDLPRGRGSEEAGPHPAVVISRTAMTAGATVLIIPLSSSPDRRRPYEVELEAGDGGLEKAGRARIQQMRVIDKQFIKTRSGRQISQDAMDRIEAAIHDVLDLAD